MKVILSTLVALAVFAHGSAQETPCEPSCPSPTALFHHPRDCTKFFHCAHNVAFEKSCPPGLHFEPKLLRCDYQVDRTCRLDPQASCADEVDVVTDAPVADCKPACPFQEGLLADPQNCNKFYQCAYGVAFSMECPSGLEFSLTDARCEFPMNANCAFDPDTECDAVFTAAPVLPEIEQESEEEVESEKDQVEKCLPTCGRDWIMAHPQECGKFVLCVGTTPHVMDCPANLHFSVIANRCEYAEIAQCTARADSPCE